MGLFALVTTLAPFAALGPAEAAPSGCAAVERNGLYRMIEAPAWAAGGGEITSYSVDPGVSNRLLASNGSVVMETRDGGCSWKEIFAVGLLPSLEIPVSSATASVKSVTVPQGRSDHVYLVVQETLGPIIRPHVVVSRDRGKTWAASDEGLPLATGGVVALEFAPSSPDTGFLLVREPGTGGETLYATTDAGATWQVRSGRGEPSISSGMAVDPKDSDLLWFWGVDLRHSTDGGRTKALVNRLAPPVPLFDIHRPSTAPARIFAYQGETQDFMRSDDGGQTWWPEGTPLGSALSVTHAPATGQLVMSVHNALFRFVEPSYWIEITPEGVEEIDLYDLQADATARPLVYGNGGTYLASYSGLNFEVRLPDVGVDPFPPIDPTGAHLSPPEKTLALPPGGRREVPYKLTLPKHPTSLDVFFLVDTSKSMESTINGLRHGMNQIVEELAASRVKTRFGVGSFKDYPIPGFGEPQAGDYPYRLDRALGPADESFTAALEGLSSSGGGDRPESQLTGVYQAVTGAGDPGFVEEGQGAGYDKNAVSVIVHMTDDGFHDLPGHPSPSMDAVATALRAEKVFHIGLAVWGQNGNVPAVRDLSTLSERSDSIAPTDVDCNGDGTADILEGQPLMCEIRDEVRTGVLNLAPAIIATVKSVTREVPVELEAVGSKGLVESVSPAVYPRIDTIEASGLDFGVTFNCPRRNERTTDEITLRARVLDVLVATAQVDIVCRPFIGPLKPKPEEPRLIPPPALPVAPAQAFVVVPPAPPAPIPETMPGTQPNSQPQGAMAEQEQEQTQLAYVHAGGLLQTEVEEELAFSDYSTRARRGVPPAALYTTAGLMALAYSMLSVARARTQTALQRIRR